MHVCVYLYIQNNCTQFTQLYTVHTHVLCKHRLLFWMRLIVINRFTALVKNNNV